MYASSELPLGTSNPIYAFYPEKKTAECFFGENIAKLLLFLDLYTKITLQQRTSIEKKRDCAGDISTAYGRIPICRRSFFCTQDPPEERPIRAMGES